MHLKTLITRILNFNEERKYLYQLKQNPSDIEFRIGLMKMYIETGDYKKAHKQYIIINQLDYKGARKSELEKSVIILNKHFTPPN